MSVVYLISSGEYPDYSTYFAMTDGPAAHEWVRLHNLEFRFDSFYVAEKELDPPSAYACVSEKKVMWCKSIWATHESETHIEDDIDVVEGVRPTYNDGISITVFAGSKEEAERFIEERRLK